MADITDLLQHAREVHQPDLRELRRVVRRRRRRAAALVTSAAVGVVALVLALPLPAERDAVPAPIAPSPTLTVPSSPTPPDPGFTTPPPDSTQGPFPDLTPEQVRSHPDAVRRRSDAQVTAAPGVASRVWEVCLGDCSRATRHLLGDLQRAVEVTSDDFRSSALYAYDEANGLSHVIDAWFYSRGRLVDGRGRSRDVSTGSSLPVTEIGGPLVRTSRGTAWIDLATLQLHPIEGAYWGWWGAADTWYWGGIDRVPDQEVLEQGLVWQNPDGSFGVHLLPFGTTSWGTQMLRSGTPGTMGAIEPGQPRLLHVSTDYGATWEVRVLPADWGGGTSVPDDWRSWTDDWPSWATP